MVDSAQLPRSVPNPVVMALFYTNGQNRCASAIWSFSVTLTIMQSTAPVRMNLIMFQCGNVSFIEAKGNKPEYKMFDLNIREVNQY